MTPRPWLACSGGSTPNGPKPVGWPSRLTKARLHFVTGKGGTGKSTIAASLALALAAGGRRVLLVEVEGRQGIAQLFDVPPLPYQEVKIATADGGGQVNALAIEIEAAFLEYLACSTTWAWRAGDAAHRCRRVRDHDRAGPARRAAHRQDQGNRRARREGQEAQRTTRWWWTRRRRAHRPVPRRHQGGVGVAKGGPVHSQAEGVVKLLHSDQTAIHLVTLLEALPMQETLEAIDELQELGLPIGSVIVNRNIPAYLGPDALAKAAEGDIDADAVCGRAGKAGIKLSDSDFAGLLTEAIQHATRITRGPRAPRSSTRSRCPGWNCRPCPTASDLGSLYELAEALESTRGPMSTTPPALDMASILEDTSNRVVVCCGAGRCRQDHHRRGDGACAPPSTAAPSSC